MINVYYSPWHQMGAYDERLMSYKEPEWLLNNLVPHSNKQNQTDNFFKCPAVVEHFKNTLILKNSSDVHVKFNGPHIINELENKKIHSPMLMNIKESSMNGRITINYSTNWIFFSDKPLQMSTSTAFAHKTEHSKFGFYVPGTYDISKWFRPVESAFQLWDNVGEFKSLEDEPLLYVKFHTDEKINLKKFYMTPEIHATSTSCIKYKMFSNNKSLNTLYKVFTQNKFQKRLLSEINKNLL